MNYFSSELDHFYDLHLNCATHHAFIENPQGMTHPHHHDDYEIYFLVSGNRKYFISNTIYTLNPNQVVIFKPNAPHQVTVNLNIPYERHLIYVTPQLFSEILKDNPCLKTVVDTQLFNLSEENFNQALEFISKINNEFMQNDLYSPNIIKTTLAQLLMFISRHNDTSNIIVDKGDLRIQAAINFMLEHYAEPITLTDCAKIASMNYYSFSKTFQKVTAIGFKEFLNRLRVDKGCELLENTNHSIASIAQSVGFSSENHFGITFKSFHNISPSAYRTRHKNK